MRYSKPVLTVIVVLMVLSLTFTTVGAQGELPPAEDTAPPELIEFSQQPQDAPIEVDAAVVQVSPVDTIVYTKKPVFVFSKNYDAIGYRIQVRQYGSDTILYTYSAAYTCSDYVCWMQPGIKLKMAGAEYTGDYEWRIAYQTSGQLLYLYSSWTRFFVADDSFTSTFDLDFKNWNDWQGPWQWNPTKGQMWTTGTIDLYNSMYYTYYYPSFDYTVRMKRKVNTTNTNGVWVWGHPSPPSTSYAWHDGYRIFYRNDGVIGVWSYKDGVQSNELTISDSTAVKPYGWNEIRVVGIYPYLDFWVNGVYLGYITLTSLPAGYYLGFDMFSNGEADEKFLVDWAKASIPSVSPYAVRDPAMELYMEPVAEGAEPQQ